MDAEKIAKLRIVQKDQAVPRRRIRWKYVAAPLILILIGAVSISLYRQGALTPSVTVQATSVAWVYPSQILTQFNASGYIVAQRKAAVASKGTGRLAYLGVREGSRVKEGDIIATLECDDLKAEEAQAEAQLTSSRADLSRVETELKAADREYRRYKALWDRRAVAETDFQTKEDLYLKTKAALESARASIKALEASVRRSSVLVEYTRIRAPFDGVILTKDADIGEVVAPFGSATSAKAAVVTMADLSSLMVEADVAESFLMNVREGQPCEIQLDAVPDTRFPGKVNTIVPTADRTRGTVMVKVAFDNLDARVMPEMSTRVAFLSRLLTEEEAKPLLAVHKDALVERNGARGLFRIEDERAQWVPIAKPELFGDYVRLASIMKEGERVVIKPPAKLDSGSRIQLAE